MKRMAFLFLVLCVAILVVGASLAYAQGQPGGPVAQPPVEGSRNPSHTAQPPRSALPDWVLHGPYNGPSPKAPAGLAVPTTPEQRAQVAQVLRANPAIQAAYQSSRPVIAAADALAQRLRPGGPLPTPTELQQHARGYRPGTARSDTPSNPLHLLGAEASPPAEPEAAEPSDEPSRQDGVLCYIWDNLVQQSDQWGEDYFSAQALNYCPNANMLGGGIRNMEISMHIYRCGAYFPTWDICLGAYHYYELWPPCEQASSAYPYLWCGPRAFYPEGVPGAYFLRAYGNTTLWNGVSGGDYVDSKNIAYRCPADGFYC